ncbi:hypothetical protein J7K25_05005 [bacterium]|nr:hypothetical protein [bacterium]
MKTFNLFVLFVSMFFLFAYSENSNLKEFTSTETSIEYIIEKIEEIEKEIKEIKEEIEEIKKFDSEIRKVVRNLQLYVQPASTLPPTKEKWEQIKRGMYKEDVENLIGNPEEIEKKRTGEEIWYYYKKGSIKFDRRGRVIYKDNRKVLPPSWR